MADVRRKLLAQYLVEKHRGGFLHIVTACMKQRVEGEIGALAQIIGIATPGHRLGVNSHLPSAVRYFQGVQTNADGGILFERLQIAFEAFLSHQIAGSADKFVM